MMSVAGVYIEFVSSFFEDFALVHHNSLFRTRARKHLKLTNETGTIKEKTLQTKEQPTNKVHPPVLISTLNAKNWKVQLHSFHLLHPTIVVLLNQLHEIMTIYTKEHIPVIHMHLQLGRLLIVDIALRIASRGLNNPHHTTTTWFFLFNTFLQ